MGASGGPTKINARGPIITVAPCSRGNEQSEDKAGYILWVFKGYFLQINRS
jgi:hypothetical protein